MGGEDFVEVFIFEGGWVDDFAESGDREETDGAGEVFGIGGGGDVFGESREDCGWDFVFGAEVEVGWVEAVG